MRRGIEERRGLRVQPFICVPGTWLMQLKMKHGHWTSLIHLEDLADPPNLLPCVYLVTNSNGWSDFTIDHDTRGTLDESRPRILPPGAWGIGDGSREPYKGDYDTLFNCHNGSTIGTIEVDTLVCVMLTANPEGSRVLT